MKVKHSDFVNAKPHVANLPGEVIKMLRELKGWTQEELSTRSGITPTNLSMLENGRVEIGRKRAELLANAFGVHPAIIMFPEYEAAEIRLAA